ncbi:hypothetical protein BEWA_030780 [Theileria equi strain WA]|uniref:Uncharacterized protein n=1 Tax=Theileria equi strain WA TaxID=1537102 RepID=L0AXD0_THEEQ|nr:hypothetical protein BEWA_030780 [Theileria equi strain WA]AFZ80225.1 hypothetical protein BEWA_030780 [Theileria equi strain WA]|eukprot:XP_004829891.1 hypothetical protein BEWA_030780 [Theileria equi strain WA]
MEDGESTHVETYLDSIRQWAEQRSRKVNETNLEASKASKKKIHTLRLDTLKCAVLCHAGHISFLNSIIDSPLCKVPLKM